MACLQVLFCDKKVGNIIELAQTIPTIIGHDALVAAQNFVDVCCQHAAYLAGRNSIGEVVKKYSYCKFKCIATTSYLYAYYFYALYACAGDENIALPESDMTLSNAKLCLLLPGNTLDLSTLLILKKFRCRGNKEGALAAMRLLKREGLGKLIPKCARRGTSAVS